MVFLKHPLAPEIDRERLRAEVYSARSVPVRVNGYLTMAPLCVLCAAPLVEGTGFHMHEALVTRGDLPVSMQDAIWHPYNVVLLCPTCHWRHGHSLHVLEGDEDDSPERRFVKSQVDRYGRERIESWLQSLPLRNPKSLSAWGL